MIQKYIITVVISLITCLLGCSEYRVNEGELILINRADQEVAKAIIEVCSQELIVEGLKHSESKRFNYRIQSDSHYKVIITFTSGQKIAKEIGYVTHGVIIKDQLIIMNNDVILKSNKRIKR